MALLLLVSHVGLPTQGRILDGIMDRGMDGGRSMQVCFPRTHFCPNEQTNFCSVAEANFCSVEGSNEQTNFCSIEGSNFCSIEGSNFCSVAETNLRGIRDLFTLSLVVYEPSLRREEGRYIYIYRLLLLPPFASSRNTTPSEMCLPFHV